MHAIADGRTQGLEEPVVTEPTVGDDHEGVLGEGLSQFHKHLDGLLEFGAKGDFLSPHSYCRLGQGLFQKVKSKRQRQTTPASTNGFQQPHGDDVLRPGIGRLIVFGGVVEETLAGEDIFPGFRIDRVIQGEKLFDYR
jgi:hypothetical protein